MNEIRIKFNKTNNSIIVPKRQKHLPIKKAN